MAASVHEIGSQVDIDIAKRGGNAVDAATAAISSPLLEENGVEGAAACSSTWRAPAL